MIDERLQDQAALHAFDLLEGSERDAFVAELARSAELRGLVADLRRVAAGLAHAAPDAEPPSELRSRVLASASVGPSPLGRLSASPSGKVVRLPAWIPWLAAACIAVAAVWSERLYLASQVENEALSEQLHVAQSALDLEQGQLVDARRLQFQSAHQIAELSADLKAEGDLAHFKISTLASMLGNTPAALAVAVWDPTREEGVLTVSKLPALAAEKDYQLWVIDSQYAAPVSGGVFVVDPVTGRAHVVFRANKPVHSIAKFAVSLERKGGAPKPEGPIVLLSD